MIQIPLSQGKFALIDDEMSNRVLRFNWSLLTVKKKNTILYYAITNMIIKKTNQMILMHRLVMGMPDKFQIDHINTNGLDNQLNNLRKCTQSQNNANRIKQLNTSSEYKGVSYCKDRKLFRAQIRINKKDIILCLCVTEIEAAIAYNNAAVKYFGEFARLNIIPKTLNP